MNVLSLFDGKYAVADGGVVISKVGSEKELVGKVTKGGYRMVVLTVAGKKLYKNVHRLVAEAFIPNPENLPEVNHIDGIKLNNCVNNLEWVATRDNQLHARDSLNPAYCKINMEIAEEIRMRYNSENISQRMLAEIFGIKKTQVGYIINNKRWIGGERSGMNVLSLFDGVSQQAIS